MAAAESQSSSSGRHTEPVRLEEVLKTAREQHGLSIRRLALRVGVHHASLARIELGEQHPSTGTLRKLAGALELDETDLFSLAGYQPPELLPSFPAYLRAKYNMPPEATAQLNEYFGYLAEKYDIRSDDAEPPTKR